MSNISRVPTDELEKVLKNTKSDEINNFFTDNKDSILNSKDGFSSYVKEIISEKNMRLQEVFLLADIPERYGYKLLSGEKRTKKRDVIIRVCYSAKFSLVEVQRALKLYGMSPLYAKDPRDAIIMVAFNENKGDLLYVDDLLEKYNMDRLNGCGEQE